MSRARDGGNRPPTRPPADRDADDAAGLRLSRRGLIAGSGLAAAAALAAGLSGATVAGADPTGENPGTTDPSTPTDPATAVPFTGTHQAGIATPQPGYLAFATYDLLDSDVSTLGELLRTWTPAASRLTDGRPLDGPGSPFVPPADSGEALAMGPSGLTLTLGLGPSLFSRLGLGSLRPAALVDLPAFAGDQLDPAWTGGDLCIQACAHDAQVAFHAVRNLTRLASGAAALRYVQIGAGRTTRASSHAVPPRNLLGFHDGTANLDPRDEVALGRDIWTDGSDQPWMKGGTFLVARRIRIHLEAWDRSTLQEQEQTVGRHKSSGAPLGEHELDDPLDLTALGPDGQLRIPIGAHVRQASPQLNGGATLLRRGFTYAEGVDRASGELDAGLIFLCFQRDPTQQFVRIQQRLSENDSLAAYLVTTGSGVFACPPGVGANEPWAAGLLRIADV